jgi:catechol 2,3-dioxygenase-like lactoylglutathione lyase family enzyme
VTVTQPNYRKPDYHRKRTGLGHVAFRVSSPDMVDAFVNEFLKPRQIEALYGGAKVYPDYAPGYYAVYFEDSDRIKVELSTRGIEENSTDHMRRTVGRQRTASSR